MRLSAKQQRVLEALRRAEAPLGAYALLDRLRNEDFKTPIQIYRILAQLIKHGLVHRLESINAYIPRSANASQAFTLFAICDNCGHVDELSDSNLGKRVSQCAQGRKFVLASTAVEIRGLCSACVSVANTQGNRAAGAH
ncbi:Fur family transcriptional regulator [Pollutimonas bauzanensis]|uniref:Fur family transcriptional regulator, zinc uptake regulator n=1 Tax=Pollutimonas bauzanensis TaxID=658167 RepID=A0A1M5LVK1_9BURK|nr:transcriptional repressor [Pollutimonas bauzanensis]SHG68413.1 Fur family transcriptional regulator, zinc uptake regulator [Pollutimonas bauzanensis]